MPHLWKFAAAVALPLVIAGWVLIADRPTQDFATEAVAARGAGVTTATSQQTRERPPSAGASVATVPAGTSRSRIEYAPPAGTPRSEIEYAPPSEMPAVEFVVGASPSLSVDGTDADIIGDGTNAVEPQLGEPPDLQVGSAQQELEPALGPMYSWQDGDRSLQVRLDLGLAVQPDGTIGEAGDNVVVDSDSFAAAGASGGAGIGPVFWSDTGELMTLPGGVALVLDPEWAATEVAAFFTAQGLDFDAATELDYVPNGFFVDTAPGFASLDLANALAGLAGVVLSSPNWGVAYVTQ